MLNLDVSLTIIWGLFRRIVRDGIYRVNQSSSESSTEEMGSNKNTVTQPAKQDRVESFNETFKQLLYLLQKYVIIICITQIYYFKICLSFLNLLHKSQTL